MEETAIYIVPFDACFLLQEVTIERTRCVVREYIPLPRRCFNATGTAMEAKRAGKRKAYAWDVVSRAMALLHRSNWWSNCTEDHPASAKACFCYRLEKEALALQTRERISNSEAKEKATDYTVKPNESYAEISKASIKRSKLLSTVLSQPKNITEGAVINNINQTTSTPVKTPALKDVGFIDISSEQEPRKTPTKTNSDKDVNNIKSSQITKTAPSKHQQQHQNKTDKTVSSSIVCY